ncbi:MAG: hypothetical protein QGG36_31210 [Pirellulaceae bacterium]|jgi:hypothetical protein|nr:hypothetical protein [Pirellulaceae bacterium]MDP7020308.1 hypothetical protein [Pirellulaceae bacterium]
MSSLWFSNIVIQATLLGQHYNHLGERFRSGARVDVAAIIFMMIVLAAVAVIAWVCIHLFNARERVRCNHPGRLFNELCRAHEISLADRRLLKQLALRNQLDHPGMLFVQPGCFDIGESTGTCAISRRVEALKQKIFAAQS